MAALSSTSDPAMSQPLVFIDGDQGTTGLQLRDRLRPRTDLRLLSLPDAERRDTARRAQALNDCDIALLCLPDDAAREAVALVRRPGVRVIDASSAHRTAPGWVYGLPELTAGQPARIATATRISNPGCYPTGALALLRPLVDAGLLAPAQPLSIHAVSGYSGGGKARIAEFESADSSAPPLLAYGLGLDHKHVPEIQHHAGLQARPIFLPAYGHFRQGIVLTIPLHLDALPGRPAAADLHAALAARHAGTRHVRLQPLAMPGQAPTLDPTALNGSDDLALWVLAHPGHRQVVLAAVFDNLGKGAAGAAVQNLDLVLQR
ncbi:N-acetyl-gamma-glutamyl-phosphate reductase [Rubrivivax pictus]|uniref:N-acetyl-gamma-glutamyl-phosphate reductase n=2 Tax=Pseudaquabacterium pictum TaxID=2315236 RepID=A0A480AT97_9BURK|nr:N-acetyl-gamma-glutamyl-phosphate reductase [Rubrivivax pictus]